MACDMRRVREGICRRGRRRESIVSDGVDSYEDMHKTKQQVDM